MEALCLFCGAGGSDLGIKNAGFNIVASIDNSKAVKQTFEANFDHRFILKDVRDIDYSQYRNKIKFLWASPPCQNLSRANNKRDEKKGFDMIQFCREIVEIVKPEFWVFENSTLTKKYYESRRSDYPVISILNSADYGVPQVRKRCFAGNFKIPVKTHDRNNNFSELKLYQTIHDVIPRPSFFREFKPYSEKWLIKHPIVNFDKPSRTVTTKDDNLYYLHKNKYYRFSPEELALIQSFPANFKFFGSNTAKYRMIGNAVPPLLAQAIAKEISSS